MAAINVLVRARHFDGKHRTSTGRTTKLGVFITHDPDDGEDGTSQVNLVHRNLRKAARSSGRTRLAYGFKWAYFSGAFNAQKFTFDEDPRRGKNTGAKTDAELIADMAADTENIACSQTKVYEQVGTKIMADLLAGKPVVIFAFGLSGSGKTYTVFGVDKEDDPNSWFYQSAPDATWGLFPRLAWEMFKMKETKPGVKFEMMFIQNVVNDVFDLIGGGHDSAKTIRAEKKPPHFNTHTWAESRPLETFEEMRELFLSASARKKVAPTQFNPQSTRGHVVVVFKIIQPDGTEGRFYVCDLAGSEKAGDVEHYTYTFDRDGEVKTAAPTSGEKGKRATMELRTQGKKINLSLMEMKQTFEKLKDQGVAGKPLKIIGQSYWINKFLKPALLRSSVYLICAIRPEIGYTPADDNMETDHQFESFTIDTLKFGLAASAVKTHVISIKRGKRGAKAVAAAQAERDEVAAERDALLERIANLESAMHEQADAAQAEREAASERMEAATLDLEGSARKASAQRSEFEETMRANALRAAALEDEAAAMAATMHAAKRDAARRQRELEKALAKEKSAKSAVSVKRQEVFDKRGLTQIEYGPPGAKVLAACRAPYLIAIESDAFTTRRTMIALDARADRGDGDGIVTTIGGSDGDADARPFGIGIESPVHCAIALNEARVELRATVGKVMLNGVRLQHSAVELLEPNDRISIGQHTWLLCVPGSAPRRFRTLAPVLCDAAEVSLVAAEAELVRITRAHKGRTALKSLFKRRTPAAAAKSVGAQRPSAFGLVRTAAVATATATLQPKPIEGWIYASVPLGDDDMVLETTLGLERAERSGAHARRLVRDISEAVQLCNELGRPEIHFALAPPVSFATGSDGLQSKHAELETELDETEFILVSASDPLVPSARYPTIAIARAVFEAALFKLRKVCRVRSRPSCPHTLSLRIKLW